MLRILHVVGNMDFGGAETLLMEVYRHIDRKVVQFDFLCHNSRQGKFDEEIEILGGKIFRIPGVRNSGVRKYKKNLFNFFINDKIHLIVHSHFNDMNGIILEQAYRAGIPVRISHSQIHNPQYTLLQSLLRKYSIRKIPKYSTDYFACSQSASEYLYKNDTIIDKCIIINNAIDTQRFRYDKTKAASIRNIYNLKNNLVFGHVGSFTRQKNHRFLVEVFKKVLQKKGDSSLMLIGTGPDQDYIKDYVSKLGIADNVLFLGSQSDIPALMSAMDVFLFPSLWEGLGIVAVEAQSMGLPVFASDAVPQETNLTDLITYIPLSHSAGEWAETILKYIEKRNNSSRSIYPEIVKEKGYDIKFEANKLQEFYLKQII